MISLLNHDAIPIIADVDLLVVGAGSAGCCAAITAGRDGDRSVMLIERYGFLGGSSTGVLDTFYGFFTPGDQPRKVVGGIPDAVVDALAVDGAMFLRPNTYGAGTGVTYNPQRLKLVWDQMLRGAGVQLRLHTMLVDVETNARGQIRSAVVFGKEGFSRIRASRYIDAGGDADFCQLAGIDFETAGDIDPAQTMTTTFQLAGVDLDAYRNAGGKKHLNERMAQAIDSGRHPLPRRSGSVHRMAVKDCVATVAVRVADLDALCTADLTRAEIEGRRQAFVYEAFLRDDVAGFGDARIINLSHQIGVRETRRVYGEYRLTRDDCLQVRRFDDSVLMCGAPIEDHRHDAEGNAETAWAYVPDGHAYDVPYRTLVPKGREDVWVAGRCFSATHDAHASCRSMGQTMSMGQAAGLAAMLSLQLKCGATDLPVSKLQDRLRDLGAVLEEPKTIAQTAADAWQKNRKQVAL